MKSQKFGIEIEMTGITRRQAAGVIAGYFHTDANYIGGGYDTYTVRDDQNRQWKIVSDASISPISSGSTESGQYKVELVSPICQYSDIETIQEIVRKLRSIGGKVNSSCGIHVHVDASAHTPKTLRNIVNIMASKEDLLYKTLKVRESRQDRYCKKADTRFLDDVNRKRPTSMSRLEELWYNGESGRNSHYDKTRYHALNLHSVFSKGTIEFRMFNSTLHAGEVKTYIQLCLAISHQALIQHGASRSKTKTDNEKYTFRTWLLRLGLIGDEFKTARHHLLKNLDGNIAWKDPAQAEKQKERLAAKREQDSAQTQQETAPVQEPEETNEQEQETSAFSMRMR